MIREGAATSLLKAIHMPHVRGFTAINVVFCFAVLCGASPNTRPASAKGHGMAFAPPQLHGGVFHFEAPYVKKGLSVWSIPNCLDSNRLMCSRPFNGKVLRRQGLVCMVPPFQDGQASQDRNGNAAQSKKQDQDDDDWPGSKEALELSDDFLPEDNIQDGKVKVFGAWMDRTVAGRGGLQHTDAELKERELADKFYEKAGRNYTLAREMAHEHTMALLEAERAFERGLYSMRRGQYSTAVSEFTNAIAAVPGGSASREGGSYTVWLAQALDAKGSKGEAIKTLKAAMGHSDRDVRRVAEGIEYIMLAPKLDLDENSFTWIELESLKEIGNGGKSGKYAEMQKMPEKYSLEWYMMQKPPPKGKPTDPMADVRMAMGATLVCACAMFGWDMLFH